MFLNLGKNTRIDHDDEDNNDGYDDLKVDRVDGTMMIMAKVKLMVWIMTIE